MRIEPSVSWTIALNVTLWPLIQILLAWLYLRIPLAWLNPTKPKESPRIYEKLFAIKRWKDQLPDGASYFTGGFAKRGTFHHESTYLHRFIFETWRGELCHYTAILFTPLFFLWNPWWGNLIMVLYSLAANLPCIMTQRYNRIRIYHLLDRSN